MVSGLMKFTFQPNKQEMKIQYENYYGWEIVYHENSRNTDYLDLGRVGIGRSRVSFQEKEVVCPAGWKGFT